MSDKKEPLLSSYDPDEEQLELGVRTQATSSHKFSATHQDDNNKTGFFSWGRELESVGTNHHFTKEEIKKLKKVESVDYFPQNSEVYKYYLSNTEHSKDKNIGTAHKHRLKWILMGFIGFFVGIIGFLVKSSIELITETKFEFIASLIEKQQFLSSYLLYSTISIILVFISSSIVVYIEPNAAASGVPEVMGYLNGVYITQIFTLKVLIIKFFSVICCVSGGLPVGPEGPMIAMGALIGHIASTIHIIPLCSSWLINKFPNLLLFNNMKDRRDFVSAGAAAGVASAFGAPVGGLLFAMEEVSSFWNQRLSWQVFFASMMSTFTTDLFMSAFGGFTLKDQFGKFSAEVSIVFNVKQTIPTNIILFIPALIIGIFGGLFGSLFTFINLKINRFRNKYIVQKKYLRILEPVIIVAIYSVFIIYIPTLFPCKTVPNSYIENELEIFDCDENENSETNSIIYNEAASLLFTSGEESISHLFSRQTYKEFDYIILFLLFIIYFPLSVWSAGSSVASGLVVPMLFIGAIYGRFIGLIMVDLFGIHDSGYWSFIDPGAFALLGAAAFFGGVSRLTMSLTVIFVEITNDVTFLLPVMTCIMISKWCADYLTHSLYHALLELKCVPFLDIISSSYNLELFPVKYIMTKTNIIKLYEIMKVKDLIHILTTYNHGGFPVVIEGEDIFIGTILTKHLKKILKNGNKIFTQNINDAYKQSKECFDYTLMNWKPIISFEEIDNYE
eukprot:392810_1